MCSSCALGALSAVDKSGSPTRALALRPCSPKWSRLVFELCLAGRAPVNREWQANVNARMLQLRKAAGLS